MEIGMETLIVSNLVLWVLVVALSFVVFALSRQIGVLHERIAPAGALTLSGGLAPGERVPQMGLRTLDGSSRDLTDSARNGRGLLLFFLSPVCPVCKSLLPVILKIAREERGWLDVVFASDGDQRQDHDAYVETHGLESFPYVLSQQLGIALKVAKLPYAALVEADGTLVSKGIVNSREHVESLFEARRLGTPDIDQYLRAVHPVEEEARASAGE